MPYLHYFYPENDCALGADSANFTGTRAAIALRRSGSVLPLFTGDSGDRYIDSGTPRTWAMAMRQIFGRDVLPFDGDDIRGLVPRPWGWSKPVRRIFSDFGFADDMLPDDAALQRMRTLSHRSTAIRLEQYLGRFYNMPALSVCLDDIAHVAEAVSDFGRAMVKLPWSSSGRGVTDSALVPADELWRRCSGTIRKQGAVIVQPYIDNAVDYGLLFDYYNGTAHPLGLSVFESDAHNTYTGSLVADEDTLTAALRDKGVQLPGQLMHTVARGLENIIGNDYTGILGVDILGIPGTDRFGVAEINLRHTMGYVAHRLARNIVAGGRTGRFTVERRNSSQSSPTLSVQQQADIIMRDISVTDNRLAGGRLELSAPDAPVCLVLTV